MIINELQLKDYRNYKDLHLTFDSNLNIIYGDNAQGKTNILEAIYVCATSKSHRTNVFKEMIRMGETESHITLGIQKEEDVHRIDVHLRQSNKKSIAINQMPIRKMDELLGALHVIMFSPEDLNLIKSGPKERRRFIDLELSQLDPYYYHYLHEFHHLLKQRNALLKQCQYQPTQENRAQLEVWDMQFVHYGIKVIEARESFIAELNTIYRKRHSDISGGKESMQLVYEKSVDKDQLEERLQRAVDKDIRFGSTSIGPHRDDLLFDMNGVDLRKFGSQGQQRTAALSLKLSEIELFIKRTDETPVLLLDDVMSELDGNRQTYLMQHLYGIQTFLTCTGVEDFIRKDTRDKQFFHVQAGEIA